jgi:precorrin-6Y C5,15-methyltransferase (decarboxylating)
MTKREVRAVILAKLGVRPEETCWDVGTGTGSVAVELSLRARRVFSVERDEKALCLAEKNRRRFGAWNLRLVHGEAPEALRALPKPDAVFVGGSGGSLPDILREIDRANPAARLCAAAVTLETLHEAVETMKALGRAPELCQLSVSRSRKAGAHTLMTAQNPVWLITGAKA